MGTKFRLLGAQGDPTTMALNAFVTLATGVLRPLVGAEYALADARKAHEDLLARRTTGKLVLRP